VLACTPHPGLGTVVYRHQAVDLATCRTAIGVVLRPKDPATVRATKDSQSIVFKGKVVLKIHESHKGFPQGSPGPIELFGTTPDRNWVLYAIDPQGSASLAADGLQLRAAPIAGGRTRAVASGLLYDDYRAWCGGRLVMTAGGDRIATHNKWLVVTGPPGWNARVLAKDPHTAFGALACGTDGNSVVVESSPASGPNMNVHAHWSIWRIGLDGSRTRLTTPPAGSSDESPHVLGTTVYFVRSGSLYALRGRELIGPLLELKPVDAYYGRRVWPYTITR
jgi:hypothetical protein